MSIAKPVTYPIAHPVAHALRKAGFIPVPRLWVHSDALPEIKRITDRYRDEVNDIRASVGLSANQGDYGPLPFANEVTREREA